MSSPTLRNSNKNWMGNILRWRGLPKEVMDGYGINRGISRLGTLDELVL